MDFSGYQSWTDFIFNPQIISQLMNNTAGTLFAIVSTQVFIEIELRE